MGVPRESRLDERYDFVAQHADTHVVLGSGETVQPTGPLPRDAGIHVVAGKARLGSARLVGTLPESVNFPRPELSPDLRWLGVVEDETLVLRDLSDGLRRGFSFHPPSWVLTIHPTGEMVAVRTDDEVQVLLPDGELLARVAFSKRDKKAHHEAITFSACGKYLWFAHAPAEAAHGLFLLRVPTLEEIDRVPVPYDPDSHYDGPDGGWRDMCAFVNPTTNDLLLQRNLGDSSLSTSFLRPRRGRIADLCRIPRQDLERTWHWTFAPSGERFAGFDKYNVISELTWPDCLVESQMAEHELRLHREEDWLRINRMAYVGTLLFVDIAYQLHILHSGSLKPVGVLPLWIEGTLLPNGMLVRQTREETYEILDLRASRKEVPVVFELDSEIGLTGRVVQRKKSGWQDITRGVIWVEPNFDLQRGE